MSEIISRRLCRKKNNIVKKDRSSIGELVIFFLLCILIFPVIVNAATGNSGDAYSQAGNFELGGGFGTPSGLNARYWFTDAIGIER